MNWLLGKDNTVRIDYLVEWELKARAEICRYMALMVNTERQAYGSKDFFRLRERR